MPIIGLDLGRHNFRAVEIDKQKDKLTLLRYGSYQNPKLNLDSDIQEELDQYSNSIKDFMEEMKFTSTNTVVSLPEHQVYMRIIKVPNLSEKDLKSAIQYEAEQYIPLPLKEVTLSYQVIDIDPLERTKVNVQLVAAKKSTLEKYVKVLKNARLVPKGIEPETLALGRVLGDTADRPSATVILNIGLFETLIIIAYRGSVRFTRSIGVGGDTLTRAVSQDLGLDYLQAEEYKKAYGLDAEQVEGKIYRVLKPLFDNVIQEVQRSKMFFTTHNPNININRVVLAGGTALMPGLFFYMANSLDVEVELSNPWKNLQFDSKLNDKKQELFDEGPIYSTSVGLALKEI